MYFLFSAAEEGVSADSDSCGCKYTALDLKCVKELFHAWHRQTLYVFHMWHRSTREQKGLKLVHTWRCSVLQTSVCRGFLRRVFASWERRWRRSISSTEEDIPELGEESASSDSEVEDFISWVWGQPFSHPHFGHALISGYSVDEQQAEDQRETEILPNTGNGGSSSSQSMASHGDTHSGPGKCQRPLQNASLC